VKSVTVSKHAGKWFVSIQTEREVDRPIPQGGAVGMDMGIARLATLSDGTFYAPLNSFKRHEARLRKAQQALSRKVKFSNNWKKAKARLQRIHSQMANARRDFLHKVSTAICRKPRDGVHRGLAGAEYVQVGGRDGRCSWEERPRQVGAEQSPSSIRGGTSSVANSITSWPGKVAGSLSCRRRTRAAPVHVAAMFYQTTARPKLWFECVACGYENNADRGSGPEAFRGSGPEAFRGSGPEAFRGSGPEAFRGSGPEAFRGSGPEAFRGSGPEAFRGSGPEAFRGSGPEAFRGSGPEAFRGSGGLSRQRAGGLSGRCHQHPCSRDIAVARRRAGHGRRCGRDAGG
jgi:putative transposase